MTVDNIRHIKMNINLNYFFQGAANSSQQKVQMSLCHYFHYEATSDRSFNLENDIHSEYFGPRARPKPEYITFLMI